MQRLRDKLAISERTAKIEAQLKVNIFTLCVEVSDVNALLYNANSSIHNGICFTSQDKVKLRLKTLEDGLRHISSLSANSNSNLGSPKTEKANHIFSFLTSNGGLIKRTSSQLRGSAIKSTSLLQPNPLDELNSHSRKEYITDEKTIKRSLWASRSRVVDSSGKENTETGVNSRENIHKCGTEGTLENNAIGVSDSKEGNDDTVSGFLYDRLQKEVISLRNFCEGKDSALNAKDQEITVIPITISL